MTLRLPRHWSEWALAAGIAMLAAKVFLIDAGLWRSLQRNGGFWYAVKGLFGG